MNYLQAYLSGELPKPKVCPADRTRYCGDNAYLIAVDFVSHYNSALQLVNEWKEGDR
jgi:hypothetical protein